MKKIFAMAFAAISLVACNNAGTDEKSEDANVSVDRDTTQTTTTTTTSSTTYTPADGDVTYRDKKVRVMRNGEWVDADDDVKLDNGVVVYRNGKVKKDDREVELEDGEVVNRAGNFFDRSGQAIENAWNKTKEGVKDAGKAVKKGAEKVGEKAKDVVDDDDDNKH